MADENEFPKSDGDVYYASEVNKISFNNTTGVNEVAMEGLAAQFCAGITPITKTYMDSEIFTDADGYNSKVDTTNTTAVYDGSNLTGRYFEMSKNIYDVWDTSIDLNKWSCFQQVGEACVCESVAGIYLYGSRNGSTNGYGCVTSLCDTFTEDGDSVYFCIAASTQSYGGGATSYAYVKYGDTALMSIGSNQSCSGFFRLNKVNSVCYDLYKSGTCLCQVTPTGTDWLFNAGSSGSGSLDSTGTMRLYDFFTSTNGGSSSSVYAVSKDFTDNVNMVYASADKNAPTGTCVTYDVLKASDCSTISSCTPINNYADTSGGNTSDIIVKYNLCSNYKDTCVCMNKFAYSVKTE